MSDEEIDAIGLRWALEGLSASSSGLCTLIDRETFVGHGTDICQQATTNGHEQRTTREERTASETLALLPAVVQSAILGWQSLPEHVKRTIETILESSVKH